MNWFQRLLHWLAGGRRLWECLVGFVAAGGLLISLECSDLGFRVAGGFLELLGVGTVALGIRQTRMQFGRPSVIDQTWNWLRSFPRWRAPDVRGSVGTSLTSTYAIARGYGWKNAPPDATTEERLAVVEENLEGLLKRFDSTEKELLDKIAAQSRNLDDETGARTVADQEIAARLESAETGGLSLSLVGTAWIVAGILLGIAPGELAVWLN